MKIDILRTEGVEPTKARAIVLDSGEVLYLEYNSGDAGRRVLLFPGGKIDGDETPRDAVAREVMEECGVKINRSAFLPLGDVAIRGLNYVNRDGTVEAEHTVVTRFFAVSAQEAERVGRTLSENEKRAQCVLRSVSLADLPELIESYQTGNLRWPFFQEEMRQALSMYQKGAD